MKHYVIIILGLTLFLPKLKAQENTVRYRIKPYVKCGPTFLKYTPNRGDRTNSESYNRWNIEAGVFDKKSGLSLTVRYITEKDGFIRNPMADVPFALNGQTLNYGDLMYRYAYFSNISVLANKNLFKDAFTKHRLEVGLGIMRRKGFYGYFLEWSVFEPRIDWQNNMSKTGILSRVSYSYLPHKNISLSLTTEYARFRNSPKDVLVLSFLVGGHF
jgi:hypothetical protein